MQTMMMHEHGITLKDYNIIHNIAEGTYGQVYKVQHKTTKQVYALKLLLVNHLIKEFKMHEGQIQIQLLKALKHPGIITLTQSFQDQQHLYLIIELCQGGDMFSLINNIGNDLSMSLQRHKLATHYLAQVVQTMAFLHSKKIIHRDLKPENIVLGANGHIKLIDFGTCKILDERLLPKQTMEKIKGMRNCEDDNAARPSFVGSCKYLAPESLGSQYCFASDVWAFGCIAYYFYHNQLPFEGENNYQIFTNIKTNDPNISSSVSKQAKIMITNCLKKDPTARPTFQQLKTYAYFKDTNFSSLFTIPNPDTLELPEQKVLMRGEVTKKMFFGNHKPRLLVLSVKNSLLCLAYKYVDTHITKRELKLNASDYAEGENESQFMVRCEDNKYYFKVTNKAKVWVEAINTSIKSHFKL